MQQRAQTINLRLKIGESERICSSSIFNTILRLKQSQFPAESVRFIYQGRELQDDMTLGQLEVPDGAVVHVVIRSTANTSRPHRSLYPEPDIDGCTVFAIFIGLTILIFLMIASSVPEYFTNIAWIMLSSYVVIGISFISYIVKSRLYR